MVGPHHAPHLINKVAEDLHAAHTVKIAGLGIAVLQRVDQLSAQAVDLPVRVGLVGGHAHQSIGAHLSPSLHDGLQILLGTVGAADEVAHRHTHGDSAVTVAELPVVIHLEQRTHGVILDIEGVDDGIGGLDLLPEEFIKTVGVNALAVHRAVEAAQAAPLEGKLRQMDHPGLQRQNGAEPFHHGAQTAVPGRQVGHDDHVAPLLLHGCGNGGRNRLVYCGLSEIHLADPLLHAPAEMLPECLRLLLSLLRGQIFHIGRQTADVLQPQIPAVVLNVAVGGGVIKMFGGGQLGAPLPRHRRLMKLHQLNKAVELAGRNEGVDRIGKHDGVRPLKSLHRRREVFVERPDAGPHVEHLEGMLRIALSPVAHRLQGNAVFTLGASVQYQNVHSITSRYLLVSLIIDNCGQKINPAGAAKTGRVSPAGHNGTKSLVRTAADNF